MDTEVKTPLAIAKASLIDPQTPCVIVPILRAGLALMEGAQGLLPLAKIYHLGLVRNETTLEPSLYLNKLPERFAPGTHLLLLDPMLATGNTIMAALDLLMARGIDANLIRLVSVVAAPSALQKLSNSHPYLTIYTAMIDEQLNDQGYIVTGLGDAGDRCFGT